MTGPRRGATVALAGWLMLVPIACASPEPEAEANRDLTECGLPTPHPKADPEPIPTPFLLDGEAEVIQVEIEEDRVIAGLGVAMNVDSSFGRYKTAISDASYELVQEDNEGFEAELYIQKGKELGSIQIRSSTCPDAVIVYLNLPREGS